MLVTGIPPSPNLIEIFSLTLFKFLSVGKLIWPDSVKSYFKVSLYIKVHTFTVH